MKIVKVYSEAVHLCQHLFLGLLLLLLFAENPPAHCEHSFEPFPPFLGILTEAANARLLNGVLDLLPATTQGSDFGILYKLGACGRDGLVDDGLADANNIRKCEVGRDHRDFFRFRVHIGCLKDV